MNPDEMLDYLLNTVLKLCTTNVPSKKHQTPRQNIILKDRKILMKKVTLNKQLQIIDNHHHHRKNALITNLFGVENEIKSSHERQSDEEENKAVSNIKENQVLFQVLQEILQNKN